MMHELVTPLTTAKKRTQNSHDLDRFLARVFGGRDSLQPGTVIGPLETSRKPMLYFGRVQRYLFR